MNTALYDPFLEATKNVFHLMLDLSDISEISMEEFLNEDGLNISIGIVGDLEGEVIYRFPKETSLSMVNIMSGMEMEGIDEFVTSAISEIANIISGNVLTLLASSNLRCDILPPVLYKNDNGKSYEIETECGMSTTAGVVGFDIRLNTVSAL